MTKKKHLGTKAQIGAEKERERRIATAIFLAIILLAAAFSGYFGYTILNSSPSISFAGPTSQFKPENATPDLKAAIVDQLTLEFPNKTFTEEATNILEQGGYTVDYYPAEMVTVDFFSSLPSCGYKIILLRVHCGHNPEAQNLGFFTSEVYSSSKYVYEQLADLLERVAFNNPPAEGEPTYFAINSLFVERSMKGRFNGTTIIMMGCYGLEFPCMAAAFVDKGAEVYIGWSGLVSASHTDQATISLIKHLILENQTVRQAGENTMNEVGPDPSSKSILGYYPDKAGEQTIEDFNGKN
jgi:hypothetical protein